MPPHLHPRSRATGTLFTSCLAVSFLIVGLPHILPCPVDPRQHADSIGDPENPRRRRRRRTQVPEHDVNDGGGGKERDETEGLKGTRECPVPKPGGLVGKVMGVREVERERPAQVTVQSGRAKREKSLARTEETP